MSKWIFNGFLVQELRNSNNFQSMSTSGEIEWCAGLEQYISWPLNDKTDEQSHSLTKKAYNEQFGYSYGDNEFALEIIPTLEYIRSYLNVCRQYNLKTRVLYIETNRERPKGEKR